MEAFADGRYVDAHDLLAQAVAEAVDLELLNDLAVAAYATGEIDHARALLEAVLAIDPEHASALENLHAVRTPLIPDVPFVETPAPASDFDAAAYWENRLAGQFGLGDVGYAGLGVPFNTWMYRVRRHVFRRHARAVRRDWSHARVLDVGSGTGFYVKNWLELGVRDLTASDITSAAVQHLSGTFPAVDVRQIDIGRGLGGLEPASFDAISAFDVLFHIVDDELYASALANVATLLRPGGRLIFTDNFVRGSRRGSRHHVSRSLEEVERAVTAAGLEIVSRRPAFVLMNDPVDSSNTRHHRFWDRLTQRLRADNAYGRRAGAALFPVEVAATRLLREGPSTEVMVCRRPVNR